ncbi:MAG TPA: hypothetical protein VFZ64_08820 [Nocardioidaceae bacterium]
MSAMTGSAKAVRYTAFTLMTLFGLLGGLFVAGYAFEDPGGWTAVLMTAAWVVPMVGLSVLALLRAERAALVLVGATAVVIAFSLADSAFGIIPRDDWGPVTAVAVLALGVTLAFLGLHRAALAGVLMIVTALGQLAATALGYAVHGVGEGGPGLGAMLGGSSGVVVLPILLVGILFMVAASLGHESLRSELPQRIRPAH